MEAKVNSRVKPLKIIKANNVENINEIIKAVDHKRILLTPKEAIERVFNNQVSYGELMDMARKKEIPSIRWSKKKVLFCEESLTEWLKNKEN